MNRRTKLVVTFTAGVAMTGVIVVRRKSPRSAGRPTMWDKMSAHMEEMPEDFPPRIMFDNAEAARKNTERILEVLHWQNIDGETQRPLEGSHK